MTLSGRHFQLQFSDRIVSFFSIRALHMKLERIQVTDAVHEQIKQNHNNKVPTLSLESLKRSFRPVSFNYKSIHQLAKLSKLAFH